MQSEQSDVIDLAKAKLGGETAKIPWRELQRFFAQGRAIHVATGLDLVEVALAVNRDDAEQVQRWTIQGGVERVSDAVARHWIEVDALVWAVVVRPWVLVQPLELDSGEADEWPMAGLGFPWHRGRHAR